MCDDASIQEIWRAAAVEAAEMNLVATLRPKIFRDGDQWVVLYGDNLQDGVAGFGDSPRKAVYDFNRAWDTTIAAMRKGEADGK